MLHQFYYIVTLIYFPDIVKLCYNAIVRVHKM